MKHILSGPAAAALLLFSQGAAYAVNCSGLTYAELLQKLKDANFPLILLDKVHVDTDELLAQESFVECPPNSAAGETAYIYSWRPINDFYRGLGVSFTFFEFPSAEARERTMRDRIAADGWEQTAIKASESNKLESDVYYYVDPNSTKAFRVERDIQYVLE